jgi:hypothetical protein
LAATAAATVAVPAPSPPTPTVALFAWPSLVNGQGAALYVFASHALNGRLRAFRRGHGHEGKPARSPGGAIGHEIDLTHRTEGDEKILQIVFRDV